MMENLTIVFCKQKVSLSLFIAEYNKTLVLEELCNEFIAQVLSVDAMIPLKGLWGILC